MTFVEISKYRHTHYTIDILIWRYIVTNMSIKRHDICQNIKINIIKSIYVDISKYRHIHIL